MNNLAQNQDQNGRLADVKISMWESQYSHNHIEIPLSEALRIVKDKANFFKVDKIRQYIRAGHLAEAKAAKADLAPFTFGGTFTERKSEALQQATGLFVVDLDKLGTQVADVKAAVMKDPHTVFAFVSPSGTGLKVGFYVPTIVDDASNKEAFTAIEAYFLSKHGEQIDKACKDIARLCYESYDADCYINYKAQPFTLAPVQAKPRITPATTTQKPSTKSNGVPDEWLEKATQRKLAVIKKILSDAPRGERHYARLRAAKVAGGFVAGGLITEIEAWAVLKPASDAIADGNKTSPSEAKALKDAYNKGLSEPIYKEREYAGYLEYLEQTGFGAKIPQTHTPQAKAPKNDTTATDNAPVITQIQTRTLSAIMATKLPPLVPIIKGLLYEDTLNILAARPKQGKSWLALGMSVAIGSGTLFMGKFAASKHEVLYFDLESSQRRIQTRAGIILANESTEVNDGAANLHFATSVPRMDKGGLEALKLTLQENPCIKLVVVDTWARFWGTRRGLNAYSEDYDEGAKLQELAKEMHVAVLVIHHTKKATEEYAIDELSGTTGITAAADAIFMLRKKSENVILHCTGRDITSEDYAVQFDEQRGVWKILGSAAEAAIPSERGILLQLLKDYARPMKTSELADLTGKTLTSTTNMLNKLKEQGFVRSSSYGFWEYATQMTTT